MRNIQLINTCHILPSPRFSLHSRGRGGHSEMNFARVILNIVTAFVACHAPRAVLVSARPSTPQAVIAVATVDQPVECLRRQDSYFPPKYLLYSEVT